MDIKLKALGVGNEYVQHKRLADFLENTLRENLQDQEERRAVAKARAAARKAGKEEENTGEDGKTKRKA